MKRFTSLLWTRIGDSQAVQRVFFALTFHTVSARSRLVFAR
jgi:hypothetical protein